MDDLLKVLEEMRYDRAKVGEYFTDLIETSNRSDAWNKVYAEHKLDAETKAVALTKAIAIIKAARDVAPMLTDLRTYGDLSRWPTADETMKMDTFLATMKEE